METATSAVSPPVGQRQGCVPWLWLHEVRIATASHQPPMPPKWRRIVYSESEDDEPGQAPLAAAQEDTAARELIERAISPHSTFWESVMAPEDLAPLAENITNLQEKLVLWDGHEYQDLASMLCRLRAVYTYLPNGWLVEEPPGIPRFVPGVNASKINEACALLMNMATGDTRSSDDWWKDMFAKAREEAAHVVEGHSEDDEPAWTLKADPADGKERWFRGGAGGPGHAVVIAKDLTDKTRVIYNCDHDGGGPCSHVTVGGRDPFEYASQNNSLGVEWPQGCGPCSIVTRAHHDRTAHLRHGPGGDVSEADVSKTSGWQVKARLVSSARETLALAVADGHIAPVSDRRCLELKGRNQRLKCGCHLACGNQCGNPCSCMVCEPSGIKSAATLLALMKRSEPDLFRSSVVVSYDDLMSSVDATIDPIGEGAFLFVNAEKLKEAQHGCCQADGSLEVRVPHVVVVTKVGTVGIEVINPDTRINPCVWVGGKTCEERTDDGDCDCFIDGRFGRMYLRRKGNAATRGLDIRSVLMQGWGAVVTPPTPPPDASTEDGDTEGSGTEY